MKIHLVWGFCTGAQGAYQRKTAVFPARAVITKLYAEIKDVFAPEKFVHIGGDEVHTTLLSLS
jgi:hypothetical protein